MSGVKARIVLMAAAMLLAAFPARGVKAYPHPIKITQPDGTSITILIHGDENYSYKTTTDGRLVYQGKDGFYKLTDSLPQRSCEAKSTNKMNPANATKSGWSVKTLVIPVHFRDRHFTTWNAEAAIHNLFNQVNYTDNGATGSVRDYFRDNLGSLCNFTFEVCDIVETDEDASYYGANSGGVTDRNLKDLVEEACLKAKLQGVDFADFDGDADGKVDNVFIVFAGHNEAEGGGDDCIWPQSWDISDRDICIDGKQIAGFSLYSEYSGADGYDFAGIGTICHEYCHLLGLVDLYDVNGETEGRSQGCGGTLSIMDEGNYNNSGRTPPYLGVIERQMLGLLRETRISFPQELFVEPVENSSNLFTIPTSVEGEEFYLEYRDGEKWDKHIGGTGLVVYHIDKSDNTAGSMSAAARWKYNAVNACGSHPCAEPLTQNTFFPGADNITSIVSSKTFPLMEWLSEGVGLGIDNITLGIGGISLEVVTDDTWDLPYVSDYSVAPLQTSARLTWEADKTYSGGDGGWVLEWHGGRSTEEYSVSTGAATEYALENLDPGGSYDCTIYYRTREKEGKKTKFQFETIRSLSRYPLIGEMEGSLKAGKTIRLLVLNLEEDYDSIVWALDGKQTAGEEITIATKGTHTLTATINYPDGSSEKLTKTLTVNE